MTTGVSSSLSTSQNAGCEDDDRIAKINVILGSAEFQDQMDEWKAQRTLLRKIVCEFWKNYQNQFEDYWKKCDSEIRTAFVLSAIEDLPDITIMSGLMPLCCPELLEAQEFVDEPTKLIELFHILTTSKENHTSSNAVISLEENDELNSRLTQPPLAEMSLKLVRSCVLLQFCSAISLIYQEEHDSSIHVRTHKREN
jgi:hypothetical protein